MTKHSPETVYQFIVAYKVANDGNSPSVNEIAVGCGIASTSNVWHILVNLRNERRVDWDVNTPRSIRVIGGKWSPPEVE